MSYRQNIKDLKERNKRLQKTDWLNTPNVYKKEEIDEIGTDNPKKITKVSTLGVRCRSGRLFLYELVQATHI